MKITNKQTLKMLLWGLWLPFLLNCAKQHIQPEGEHEPDNYNSSEEASINFRQELNNKVNELDTLNSKDRASELYILSLNNFMAMGTGDRRIPEMIMKKADFYFEQSLYSDAIESYRVILTEYKETPMFVEAMKKIAVAYVRNGEMENAQNWYSQLRGQGKDSLKKESRTNKANIMFIKARGLTKNKKYSQAKKVYLEVAAKYPELEISTRSLFSAGFMEETEGKWAQAINLYENFLQNYQESPLVPKVLFHEAYCWFKNGNYNKAAKKFLKVIKNFPSSLEAEKSLLQAGISFENDNRLVLAGRTFEKYAELYPDSKKACTAVERANNIYKKSDIQENFDRVKSKYLGKCYEKTGESKK